MNSKVYVAAAKQQPKKKQKDAISSMVNPPVCHSLLTYIKSLRESIFPPNGTVFAIYPSGMEIKVTARINTKPKANLPKTILCFLIGNMPYSLLYPLCSATAKTGWTANPVKTAIAVIRCASVKNEAVNTINIQKISGINDFPFTVIKSSFMILMISFILYLFQHFFLGNINDDFVHISFLVLQFVRQYIKKLSR